MAANERPWDCATQDERVSALPNQPVAQALTEEPTGLFEMRGRWQNFECAIDAPVSWLDTTLRLDAAVTGVWVPLEIVRLADLPLTLVLGVGGTARLQGLLFSVHGRPANAYRVSAWRTTVDHAQAVFGGRAWGDTEGATGDRAQKLRADLWCAPGQARTFTSGLAGIAPVGIIPIFTANPLPRGRVDVSELVWTKTDAGAATLVLQETVGPIVRAVWGLAGPGIARETWNPPLRSAPNSGWEIILSAGAAVSNLLNVNAFDE